MPGLTLLRSLFVLAALATALCAQSVRWEPSSGTLVHGQTNELQLIFEGCSPDGNPTPPTVPGLTLQRAGQSSVTSIINGRVTQTEALTFQARPTQRTRVNVPAFEVATDKGKLRVASVTFEVGDATVGGSNQSLENIAKASFVLPRTELWAGEIVPLRYNLNVARHYFHSLGNNMEWNPAPFVIEDWSKPELQETSINGQPIASVVYQTRGYVKTPGNFTLDAANQLVNLTTGSSSFGFFSRPNLEQFAIASSRPQITVRALPTPAPNGFNGGVGQFQLASKVVPASAVVGEPVTWTLELTGAGNWPDLAGLPARDVSKDFRVVQPQAKKVPKEGTLFDATLTEDVVLIPTRPGTYRFGPFTWSYFDPARGEYQTITTEATTLTVTAANLPTPSPAAPSTDAQLNISAPAPGSRPAVVAPAAPSAIPREALSGSDPVRAPWSLRTVVWLAITLPLALFLAVWIFLALRRARATDPVRPQREAHLRLQHTIAALRTVNEPARARRLLQDWLRDTALLWQLPRSAPSSIEFHNAPTTAVPSATPETRATWTQLWLEAERALYSASTPLPADWTTRADSALAAQRLRPFSLAQLFQPRNLLPFAAALILSFNALPMLHAAAEDAVSTYTRGEFAKTEQASRAALAQAPTDWIARHNLALALAQQDRWGEAAAQLTAAFVQNPVDASTRWHLRPVFERAGYLPPVLADFLQGSPVHALAARFSPAAWQCLLLLGAILIGVAGSLALARAYRADFGGSKAVTVILGIAALGLIASSAISLRLYSLANDKRAAVVWRATNLRSIPTEADTTQKTTPLAAGSLAIMEKPFLGWTRLAFPNGQTGWVRQEDLVPLWK